MTSPRIVLLYSPSIANDYVVAALQRDAPRAPVLVVAEQCSPLAPLARVLFRRSDALLVRIDRLAFLALYGIRLRCSVDAALQRLLGPSSPVVCDARVSELDRSLEAVRAARPDLILVMGTSILGAEWMRLGVTVVNVHTGLTPAFRGRFCWFWPVALGRPDELGVTLHEISTQVDAGRVVLRRAAPTVPLPHDPAEAMATLLAIVTRLAVALCRELVSDPARLSSALDVDESTRAPPRAFLEPGLRDYLRFTRALRVR